MAQDLRERFKQEREAKKFQMKSGHEDRFLERLNAELPEQRKNSFVWLKIAACFVLISGIAYYGYQELNNNSEIPTTIVDVNKTNVKEGISLGDLSPDLKKIEHYYVGNINLALSKLQVSTENESLVNSFMDQLSDLNTEYERLNEELNQIGPNDQTISALIQNLQYRLQLLQQLKKKLNELNSLEDEQVISNSI